MQNTKIEWTDHTFNGWTGCTKVSPGCANCYAEGWAKRSGIVQWGPGAPRRRTSGANWRLPLKWNRDADKSGTRPRVFCASLADWLDDEVPAVWLAELLGLIRETPNLDWLLLTKRPENWKTRIVAAHETWRYGIGTGGYSIMEDWLDGIAPPNVWIGTTVENQEMADKRIPQLLAIPAKVRFLSCEPLLGPVDLRNCVDWWNCEEKIHWVICGGESGPKARPMHQDWARSLRDQCEAAGVPFFMKQMGGVRKPFAQIPDDLNIRQFPTP